MRASALRGRGKKRGVLVRLEGGIGDHVLGMRVLPFVRKRFPRHPLVLMSDCGGHAVQAAVAAMSPLADDVVIGRYRDHVRDLNQMGRLENLDDEARAFIKGAHAFIDAWGNKFFLEAASLLQVPFFEILSGRPALVPSAAAEEAATRFLEPYSGQVVITMSLSKYGRNLLAGCWEPLLAPLLGRILADPRVVIFNLFSTRFAFPQWPPDVARYRESLVEEEVPLLRAMSDTHERIIPAPDLDIGLVAALLRRSAYFIGVDNGLKHLAWAFHVPRTVLHPDLPDISFAVRWMPDVHRLLLFSATPKQVLAHARHACEAVACALLRPASPRRD